MKVSVDFIENARIHGWHFHGHADSSNQKIEYFLVNKENN